MQRVPRRRPLFGYPLTALNLDQKAVFDSRTYESGNLSRNKDWKRVAGSSASCHSTETDIKNKEYAMKTLKWLLTRAALITGERANINFSSRMKPTRLIRRSFLAQATAATHFLTRTMSFGLGVLALAVTVAAQAAAPAITSFSANGVLVCRNLAAGSVATVEWTSSPTGPWTNNWAGLDAVTADANGKIQVSVPMFYRVRGITY